MVTMPSIAKILSTVIQRLAAYRLFAYICQPLKKPTELKFRIAEAIMPPKAPARGAIDNHSPRRKVNSDLLYHRER